MELSDPHHELEIDITQTLDMSLDELVEYKSAEAWCFFAGNVRLIQHGELATKFHRHVCEQLSSRRGERCWVCFRDVEDKDIVATACCPNKKIHLDCWEKCVNVFIQN